MDITDLSDDDHLYESDEESEEELESTARVLDICGRQHHQIAQATSMMIDLLEWDDDKMGDQLEIHYVVFTTSYIICSLAMSPVSSELSALP